MEIVVTGRNVEIPDHFREHIADKVARLERYDHKIVGLEVELFHERNRRQFYASPRHTMEVDFDHYLWDLRRERQCGAARAGSTPSGRMPLRSSPTPTSSRSGEVS